MSDRMSERNKATDRPFYLPGQSPTDKVQRIVCWLMTEAATVIESNGCNWKLTIHGGPGKDIKTVIEKFANLE